MILGRKHQAGISAGKYRLSVPLSKRLKLPPGRRTAPGVTSLNEISASISKFGQAGRAVVSRACAKGIQTQPEFQAARRWARQSQPRAHDRPKRVNNSRQDSRRVQQIETPQWSGPEPCAFLAIFGHYQRRTPRSSRPHETPQCPPRPRCHPSPSKTRQNFSFNSGRRRKLGLNFRDDARPLPAGAPDLSWFSFFRDLPAAFPPIWR